MQVIEVSQFYFYHTKAKDFKWSEITKCEEKGCVPSVDGTTYLFSEKPKIKEVSEMQECSWGCEWYIEGENDTLKLWKSNYDTSD